MAKLQMYTRVSAKCDQLSEHRTIFNLKMIAALAVFSCHKGKAETVAAPTVKESSGPSGFADC
jgi:hypothetical protein